MAWIIKPGKRIIDMSAIAWIGIELSHYEYAPPVEPDPLTQLDIPTEAAESPEPEQPEIPNEAIPPEPSVPIPSRALYRIIAVYKNPWSSGHHRFVNTPATAAQQPVEPPRELGENASLTNKLLADAIEILRNYEPPYHVTDRLEDHRKYIGVCK